MNQGTPISYKSIHEDNILQALIDDPTKSVREMSKDLNSYRQKVWRRKKKLENDNVIWGYTSVIDESKLNCVMYLVLMKLEPMSKELADLVIRRLVKKIPQKQHINLLNVLYINGQYDQIVMFTASNHAIARKYFDSLRKEYKEYLLEKPVIVDVSFILIAEGKSNPDVKRLYDFVPSI